MRITAALTIALLLAGTASSLGAQSLAEVARQETDRRQAAKTPGKVYTNSDLKSVPQPPPSADTGSPTPAPTPASVGTGDAKAASDAKTPEAPRPEADEKSEKYWSKRMRDSREQLDQERVLADALQSRINALTTDFVNRDDPAQRAKIGADRQRALNELEKLKKAIEVDTKAITALEEEARRKGIPPGWLR